MANRPSLAAPVAALVLVVIALTAGLFAVIWVLK
jgi:hypothetical protein